MSKLPRLLWTAALTVGLAIGGGADVRRRFAGASGTAGSGEEFDGLSGAGEGLCGVGPATNPCCPSVRPGAAQWIEVGDRGFVHGVQERSIQLLGNGFLDLLQAASRGEEGAHRQAHLLPAGVVDPTLQTVAVTPVEPISGETFTVSDSLAGKKVARPVVLLRQNGKRWVSVATGMTSSSAGVFSLATSTTASSVKLRVVAKKVRIRRRPTARSSPRRSR